MKWNGKGNLKFEGRLYGPGAEVPDMTLEKLEIEPDCVREGFGLGGKEKSTKYIEPKGIEKVDEKKKGKKD